MVAFRCFLASDAKLVTYCDVGHIICRQVTWWWFLVDNLRKSVRFQPGLHHDATKCRIFWLNAVVMVNKIKKICALNVARAEPSNYEIIGQMKLVRLGNRQTMFGYRQSR